MPGGVDLNNHEDVFRVVSGKSTVTFITSNHFFFSTFAILILVNHLSKASTLNVFCTEIKTTAYNYICYLLVLHVRMCGMFVSNMILPPTAHACKHSDSNTVYICTFISPSIIFFLSLFIFYCSFFSTEHSAALLSVLHKLLLLERDSPTTGPAFAALNRFMENALTITEPGQADRVAQV